MTACEKCPEHSEERARGRERERGGVHSVVSAPQRGEGKKRERGEQVQQGGGETDPTLLPLRLALFLLLPPLLLVPIHALP
eukprot:3379978-Rhodomonas_salina.1